MAKSATEVMQEIVFSAVIDALVALKSGSKGVPNALLRDVNAVHPNTTIADLPDGLRAALEESVRQAFGRLRKEGYTVGPVGTSPPPSRPRPPASAPPRPAARGRGTPPPKPPGSRPPGGKPPRGGPKS
jgi:hypothetical protein